MRTSSISLLAALAGVIALLFCLAAVPLQQKAPAAAPFCKTTEEHQRLHGAKHAHREHRAHQAHQAHETHGHTGAHQQHHQHFVPPAVIVSPPSPIQPISPAATLKLDAFDAPSPLSVAEAEKAKRSIRR